MKRTKHLLAALLILWLPLSLPSVLLGPALVLSAGCKSPRTTAFRTLEGVAIAVDHTRQAWADLKAQGRIAPEAQARFAEAVHKYQAAANLALDAVQFDLKAAAPADVQRLAADLSMLLAEILNRPTP